jgi:hypothetical protein
MGVIVLWVHELSIPNPTGPEFQGDRFFHCAETFLHLRIREKS